MCTLTDVLLVFVITVYFCSDQCVSAVERCVDTLPGLEKLVRGIDVTQLDLFIEGEDGFKKSVFEYTCEEGRKWTDPQNKTIVRDVPDQVAKGVLLMTNETKVTVFTDYDGRRKLLAEATGLNEELLRSPGIFSRIAIKSQPGWIDYEAEAKQVRELFEVLMDVNQSLSRDFSAAFRNLEDKDFIEWDKFFATYGTHYFESGRFGGQFGLKFKVIKNKEPMAEVEAKAIETLSNYIREDSGLAVPGHDLFILGGFGRNTYKDWSNTLLTRPHLISGQLRPLSDLLQDGPQKDVLIKSTDNYLRRAFLGSLEQTLVALNEEPQKYLENVRNLLQEISPDPVKVNFVGNWVENYKRENGRRETEKIRREREEIRKEREEILRERDEVMKERNEVKIERDAIASEREDVRKERQVVVNERNAILKERAEVRRERDEVRKERRG